MYNHITDMNVLIKRILSEGKIENPSHSQTPGVPQWRGAGSQLQSNGETQTHFPLQCKDIKDRLNAL